MPRRECRRHGQGQHCSCSLGNLYRFVEPLLLFLLRDKGESHGYDLVSALNQHALTDSIIEPGALYRTLRRLEENGHVVSNWDVEGTGPARRFYRLTPSGEEHLREWITVLDNLSVSMAKFVQDARRLTEKEKD